MGHDCAANSLAARQVACLGMMLSVIGDETYCQTSKLMPGISL
jgi:hypothetical protein